MVSTCLLSFPLFLCDVEVDQLSLLPVFRSFLTIHLDQLALSVANIVVVGAGENIAATKGVRSFSLLDAVDPLALVNSNIFLVLVGTFSLSDALRPLSVVNVSVGVRVLAFSVLLVLFVVAFIFESI